MVKLLIDQLLVRSVDQGQGKGSGSANEGKTPNGNKLDEEVGDESSDESLSTVS